MATITLTTDPAQDARIVKAFGAELRLGRDATLAEIKGAIRDFVVGVVLRQEKFAAKQSAAATYNSDVAAITPVDVT